MSLARHRNFNKCLSLLFGELLRSMNSTHHARDVRFFWLSYLTDWLLLNQTFRPHSQHKPQCSRSKNNGMDQFRKKDRTETWRLNTHMERGNMPGIAKQTQHCTHDLWEADQNVQHQAKIWDYPHGIIKTSSKQQAWDNYLETRCINNLLDHHHSKNARNTS